MKLVSIAAFLLSFLWCFLAKDQAWSVQVRGYLEVLVLAVWATALIRVAQTILAHKYFWAVGFVSIAVMFNPIVLLTISRSTFLVLDSICISAFVLSLAVLRTGVKRSWAIQED
jgi:Family of unknown function (DUF6804)